MSVTSLRTVQHQLEIGAGYVTTLHMSLFWIVLVIVLLFRINTLKILAHITSDLLETPVQYECFDICAIIQSESYYSNVVTSNVESMYVLS